MIEILSPITELFSSITEEEFDSKEKKTTNCLS